MACHMQFRVYDRGNELKIERIQNRSWIVDFYSHIKSYLFVHVSPLNPITNQRDNLQNEIEIVSGVLKRGAYR
jgi:hypothetical protein